MCEWCDFSPSLVRVVMVLGAGRGPLVRAALKAAQTAERDIKVYAVEKNPGALVTYALLPHPSIHPSISVLSVVTTVKLLTFQLIQPSD